MAFKNQKSHKTGLEGWQSAFKANLQTTILRVIICQKLFHDNRDYKELVYTRSVILVIQAI